MSIRLKISILFYFILLSSGDHLNAQKSRGEIFVEQYYPNLFRADTPWFKSELRRYSSFFSFRTAKRIKGKSRVLTALENESLWFLNNGVDTSSFKALKTIYTREKMVHLAQIDFPEKNLTIPLAIIADIYDDGINDIRTYYCKNCIDSLLENQNPLFVHNPNLESVLPPVVYNYVINSKYGRSEKMESMFADSAQLVLQNGLKLTKDKLLDYYSLYLKDKGIKIEPTRLCYDGRKSALEWNMWKWGDQVFSKSSGMTFVEFNGARKITQLIQFDQFNYPDTLLSYLDRYSVKEIKIDTVSISEKVPPSELSDFKIDPSWYVLLVIILLLYLFIHKTRIP